MMSLKRDSAHSPVPTITREYFFNGLHLSKVFQQHARTMHGFMPPTPFTEPPLVSFSSHCRRKSSEDKPHLYHWLQQQMCLMFTRGSVMTVSFARCSVSAGAHSCILQHIYPAAAEFNEETVNYERNSL